MSRLSRPWMLFGRQVHDMVYKFSKGGSTGECDPCLPPPPTPAPTPTPPPTPHTVYDPSKDYCFKAIKVDFDQYCWDPTATFPSGYWEGVTAAGYDNCGPRCTPSVYDPSQDYCFSDKDNVGKYCWCQLDYLLSEGNWEGKGGRGYNDCGLLCTKIVRGEYHQACRDPNRLQNI